MPHDLVPVGVASSVYWTPNYGPELCAIFTANSEFGTIITPFPYEEAEAHMPLRGKHQDLSNTLPRPLPPPPHPPPPPVTISKPCFWMRPFPLPLFPGMPRVTASSWGGGVSTWPGTWWGGRARPPHGGFLLVSWRRVWTKRGPAPAAVVGEGRGHAACLLQPSPPSFLSPGPGLSSHLPGQPGEGVREPDLSDSWLGHSSWGRERPP